MLVIHWAKQNRTSRILKNGIRPSQRRKGKIRNPKGVYVYPYSHISVLNNNWRFNLKVREASLANFYGLVFRPAEDDFPLFAGYHFLIYRNPDIYKFHSKKQLAADHAELFTGQIVLGEIGYSFEDFEIIIPRLIEPSRIIRVMMDRRPDKLN